jgi:hypothetical protein
MNRKAMAYRIADHFLELRKVRRDELARLIERELDYVAEAITHQVNAEHIERAKKNV